MDSEKKEVGAWWFWLLFLIIFTSIVFTGLNYFGIIGRTIVEREVFTHSQQYTEARKSEIATLRATIAEIEGKLMNPQLDEQTRINLNAQLSGLNIQLANAMR